MQEFWYEWTNILQRVGTQRQEEQRTIKTESEDKGKEQQWQTDDLEQYRWIGSSRYAYQTSRRCVE